MVQLVKMFWEWELFSPPNSQPTKLQYTGYHNNKDYSAFNILTYVRLGL